jgi:hypothetical protein
MHDGTIAQGNAWLASHVPTILNSKAYQSGTTAVFTKSGSFFDHYSLPGTTEQLLGLPRLASASAARP